jgi:heme oxygenase
MRAVAPINLHLGHRMSPSRIHSELRDATAGSHAAVDLAFSKYDLTTVASYGEFLCAHARALGGLEHRLTRSRATLPPWSSRMAYLAADLEALGIALPRFSPLTGRFSNAVLHGMLYVVEGSRFGSMILARRVPPAFPSAFLRAAHAQGEWQSLLTALDTLGSVNPAKWITDAVVGAQMTFEHYLRCSSTVSLITSTKAEVRSGR